MVCCTTVKSASLTVGTVHGAAYFFGKLPASGYASGSKGIISIHEPVKLAASSAGAKEGTKFIGGALSRTHFLLVDEHGVVYGCGNNGTGQLGLVCRSLPCELEAPLT